VIDWIRPARTGWPRAVAVSLLVVVAFGVALPSCEAGVGQKDIRAAGQEELAKGIKATERNQLKKAIKLLERADSLAPQGSVLARLELAKCHARREDYGRQVDAARGAAEIATTSEQRLEAYRLLASGLIKRATTGKGRGAEDFLAAAEALGHAVDETDNPNHRAALTFDRGVSLMRAGKDGDGTIVLLEYLRLKPDGAFARLARSYVERPARARENLLPDMALDTLDGDRLTDETLEGKVLVLDSWATWCGPCRAALPTLRNLHQLGEESGFLTVVSISSEPDDKVSAFAHAHDMN